MPKMQKSILGQTEKEYWKKIFFFGLSQYGQTEKEYWKKIDRAPFHEVTHFMERRSIYFLPIFFFGLSILGQTEKEYFLPIFFFGLSQYGLLHFGHILTSIERGTQI